jgi:2-aminoadipate transaminase
MKDLQPSAIREIFKFLSDPTIISFAAGNPAPEAFPIDIVRQISAEIFSEEPVNALQYSLTEGYPPLRALLKNMLATDNRFNAERDELIITAGAQQVMDLTAKVLTNEGDTVITENPSFIGSLNTFRSYRLNLRGIDMDDEGIDIAAFEQAIKEKKPAFVYLIPNFQNPTGNTTSLKRRKEILNVASKYEVIILEDNPYGDLRFDGEHIPSLKELDTEGRVIYAGTFSKTLAPGLRVGFMSAPNDIVQKAVVALQTSTVHTNIWAQLLTYRFLGKVDYITHCKNLSQIYKKKCNLMLSELDKQVSREIVFTKPQGGLFLWGSLPHGDMNAFCLEAVKNKVALVPGTAFLADEKGSTLSFRLNYSTPTDEQIINGVKLLGDTAKQLGYGY